MAYNILFFDMVTQAVYTFKNVLRSSFLMSLRTVCLLTVGITVNVSEYNINWLHLHRQDLKTKIDEETRVNTEVESFLLGHTQVRTPPVNICI